MYSMDCIARIGNARGMICLSRSKEGYIWSSGTTRKTYGRISDSNSGCIFDRYRHVLAIALDIVWGYDYL